MAVAVGSVKDSLMVRPTAHLLYHLYALIDVPCIIWILLTWFLPDVVIFVGVDVCGGLGAGFRRVHRYAVRYGDDSDVS